MTRAIREWIGKTDDTRIPPRVKARIIVAQEGVCACGCGMKLGIAGERIEFDHRVALINGGENRESNIQALRRPCHQAKTRSDVAEKANVARIRKKHLGLHEPKTRLPGSRGTRWKRKIDGTTVPRED